MTNISELDPGLIEAYKATNFHVNSQPPFALNIGIVSPYINELYSQYNVTSSAFITAWNPFSKTLSADENRSRNDSLKKELISRNLKFIDGCGKDPSDKWSGEDSFLVMGVDLEESKDIGCQFEQNAIVWININAIPNLILLK